MTARVLFFLFWMSWGTGVVFAQSARKGSSQEQGVLSHTLTIGGKVKKTITYTVADLEKMSSVRTVKNVAIIGKKGQVKKRLVSFKGVLLKDLLEKAGIAASNFKEQGHFYIVAAATDNYKVVFSWSELFNSATGNNIFVIFQENGRPVDKDGLLALISTGDHYSGLRYVKWLNRIEVHEAG